MSDEAGSGRLLLGGGTRPPPPPPPGIWLGAQEGCHSRVLVLSTTREAVSI